MIFQFGDPSVEDVDFVARTAVGTPTDDEEPDYVNAIGRDDLDPFVNTGRHVYRKFVVAFDAVIGQLGFELV